MYVEASSWRYISDSFNNVFNIIMHLYKRTLGRVVFELTIDAP